MKPELLPIRGLASGETLHLPVFRFRGEEEGAPSAYLQASLHGAEVQGSWVIAELLDHLPGIKIKGNITLVPLANPYGQNHKIGDYTLGRFDPVDGDNWNRMFVDCTKLADSVSAPWPAAKTELRRLVAAELARVPAHEPYSKKLARTLQGLAFPHDFLLDLHCAALCESYAYVPDYAFAAFRDLPCRHAVRVPEGFGGAMDEAFVMPWWRLGRRIEAAGGTFPTLPEGYTLELGHQDWSDPTLARRQALGILRYLARRGVIEGEFPGIEFPSRYSCALKDFHTDISHRAGLVGLRAKLGEIQEKGEPYCEYLGFRDFARDTVPCSERRITLVFTNASSVHEGTELGKSLVNFAPPMNPRVPKEISALRRLNARAKPTTLNLGLGQPAIDMPPALRALAQEAILKHPMGYTPNAGRPELREAVASLHDLDAAGVTLCSGAQEGLMAVLTALLSPGDEVLVPDPGFLAYPTMVRMAGGEARTYSGDPVAALGERTRAVIVCSPNNPDGAMISAAERARWETELARREIFLLSDDVYAELAFHEPYHPSCSPFAVTISSWSKSLALTGWRIGFTHTAHPELRKSLLAAHQYLVTCTAAPAQALLLEILRRPELYRATIEGFRAEYATQLGFLAQELGQPCPAGGFYLFLPVEGSDVEVAERLLTKHDLLTVPGSYFGPRGAGHLRLSAAASMEVLARAAKILKLVPLRVDGGIHTQRDQLAPF